MKRVWFLLLSLSLGLNAGMLYEQYREPRGPHPDMPPPPERFDHGDVPAPEVLIEEHLSRLRWFLELDDAQTAALREVLEREMPKMQELHGHSFESRHAITEAFAAEEFDPEVFREIVTRANAHRLKVDSLSAEMLIAEALLLTPEQRAKLAEVAPTSYTTPMGSGPIGSGGPPGHGPGPGPEPGQGPDHERTMDRRPPR